MLGNTVCALSDVRHIQNQTRGGVGVSEKHIGKNFRLSSGVGDCTCCSSGILNCEVILARVCHKNRSKSIVRSGLNPNFFLRYLLEVADSCKKVGVTPVIFPATPDTMFPSIDLKTFSFLPCVVLPPFLNTRCLFSPNKWLNTCFRTRESLQSLSEVKWVRFR